jgi:hypothetical protein
MLAQSAVAMIVIFMLAWACGCDQKRRAEQQTVEAMQ